MRACQAPFCVRRLPRRYLGRPFVVTLGFMVISMLIFIYRLVIQLRAGLDYGKGKCTGQEFEGNEAT